MSILSHAEGDGGPGFCYTAIPDLFLSEPDGHGPLLVSIDSNILIDIQEYGEALMEQDPLSSVEEKYRTELHAMGYIIDVWMGRDIRFILSPRMITDAKKNQAGPRIQRKLRSIDRLTESLQFNFYDANLLEKALRFAANCQHDESKLSSFPPGGDRTLIAEAISLGVHVFLTRDKAILRARNDVNLGSMKVLMPSELETILRDAEVGPMFGGFVRHAGCPYAEGLLFGDTGKWQGLFEVFEE